ncbi:hypothetical protein ACIOHN_46020, partial [Streptomyces sp. NPDC087856]
MLTRRGMGRLGVAAATTAVATAVSGCAADLPFGALDSGAGKGKNGSSQATAKPIGDGSTSFTGAQPKQPAKPVPLEPGQTPPQFVIFSW